MSQRTIIAAGFVVLFFLHQDFWWQDDPTLVLGVLPVSLAYHVVWTLVVAVGWLLVGKYCWPDRLDEAAPPETLARVGDPSPASPRPATGDAQSIAAQHTRSDQGRSSR